MGLQIATNINVDFYDKQYIMINAKQYDSSSRLISITCYDQGKIFNLDASKHSAYIRYRKADGNSVLNSCIINYNGQVLVELTEQMLSVDGICYVDLIIVNKGSARINVDTGEIITIDDSPILSTMAFCINVYEASVDNSLIESTYKHEVNALNELFVKANAEYEEVVLTARSYATGDSEIRVGEETDNAKYYSMLSKSYAVGNADGIRDNENNDNSKYYQQLALVSAETAKISKTNAAESANRASDSASSAASSANSAFNNASYAYENAELAHESEMAAKGFAATSEANMNSASNSAESAIKSATEAHNYYLRTEAIANGLNGAFLPMGTITFAELTELKENGTVGTGYLYNISDNFVTDDTFKMGAGVEYEAGTNVYYTADGYWDCLAGTTVTGIKGGNETIYRKGNVNLTADNIGAIPVSNMATVDEIKGYLGI